MSTTSLATIQRSQFWIFQLSGWTVWVAILLILTWQFVPIQPGFRYLLPFIPVYCASALAGIVLTTGLRHYYRLVWEKGWGIRLAVAIAGSFLGAVIWQPFQNYVNFLPFGEPLNLAEATFDDLFDNLFVISYPIMLLWSGFYFSIKYYQLFLVEKEKSLRSEALAHEAQLLMLRYQLNPHFLFNTLNAISTLVLTKSTEQANEMVTKLSKFLRYSLDHSPLDRVSFSHELETSRLYLDIEKVRFADRLKLEFDIEPEAEMALVPTMLLQPIIENSIKHGITNNEEGGTIIIKARKRGRLLTLEVTDDGPGLSEEDADEKLSLSKGVGISNIRNRLQEIYGNDHELMFTNVEPRGLAVTVVIPYDTK